MFRPDWASLFTIQFLEAHNSFCNSCSSSSYLFPDPSFIIIIQMSEHHEPVVPEDHTGGHQGGGHSDHHSGPLVVFFIAIGLLLGGILREINKKTKIPYTPMLLVLGIFLGYFKNSLGVIGESTAIIEKLNPHMILLIFIPVLIFESAFNCEWHVFRKSLVNILTLAGPGVLWGAILIAVCFKTILAYPDDELSWYEALTLGCVLSATDPVAVVALLKELGASVRFNTLVEGESLMNDGTAMVFFALFIDLAKGNSSSLIGVVGSFVRIAFGGPLLGMFVGFLMSYWMKRIIRDPVLSINITFVGAYLCFYFAEFSSLKVSGILSIVVLGLYMSAVGRRKIYPESEHALHNAWGYIQYGCETLIFILTGIVVGVQMIEQSTIRWTDWFRMFLFWFLMIGLRTIMVLTFYPILKRFGYGLTKKEMIVLIYGGLRGALGLCLSLIVGVDDTLPQRFREITVFYMCGMAFLTIVVNGLTCGKVVNYLEMISYPEVKRKLLKRCVKDVLASTQKKMKELKNQPSVAYAEWKDVEKFADIKRLGETEHERRTTIVNMGSARDVRDSTARLNKNEVVEEIRFRFTRYLNKVYWELFEHGELSEESIQILSENCDIINDDVSTPLRYFEVLSSNFTVNAMKFYMRMKDLPIVGPTATKFLINQVYFAYEITTAFIESCEETIHVFDHSFPLHSDHVDLVINEVKDSLEQAISYVAELENNYPTVIKAVHTTKASTVLLKHKKHMLKEMHEEGFVDDTDYATLRKEIDMSLVQVQIHNFELSEVKFNEVLTECPLFSNLPTSEIVNIRMKSTERVFPKNSTILAKGKEVKNIYFIICGSVKEQFDDFYFMRGIGNVLNPHDFIYQENSKATIKASTETKVMQIQDKFIFELLSKYPDFKRKWYKSVFSYALKLGRGLDFIKKDFTERELRRFIEGSTVVLLKKGESALLEHGGFVFSGEVQTEGSNYSRGNFISKGKGARSIVDEAILLQFQDVVGLKFQEERISQINENGQDDY